MHGREIVNFLHFSPGESIIIKEAICIIVITRLVVSSMIIVIVVD